MAVEVVIYDPSNMPGTLSLITELRFPMMFSREKTSSPPSPTGYLYTYAWYHCKDDGVPYLAGKGKTHTVTIDSGFCDHEGAVWVGLADPTLFYLTNGNTGEPITSNDIPLEVA